MTKLKMSDSLSYFPIKLKKKIVRHDLGYSPFIYLFVERIKGKKQFPYFDFKPGYISELDFYFYHERYSKKEFVFRYRIYKEQEPEFVEEKVV